MMTGERLPPRPPIEDDGGDQRLQRERRTDDAQPDRAAIGGEQHGDAEDDEDAGDADQDTMHDSSRGEVNDAAPRQRGRTIHGVYQETSGEWAGGRPLPFNIRHPREGGDPDARVPLEPHRRRVWIPACAGMTWNWKVET
jgi:hypothetical protein